MPAIKSPVPTVSVPSGRGIRLLSAGCEVELEDVGLVNDKNADVTHLPVRRYVS